MTIRKLIACLLFLVTVVGILFTVRAVNTSTGDSFDWRSDWAVDAGAYVGIDTTGYTLPSAIAFVPHPGPNPKDPLYFVTELRGKIKVITNDRTIYTFAEDFFQLNPQKELPELEGETGLAGICLAPAQGYVFVTFAYQDDQQILRNNIIRFESVPNTFSTQPVSHIDFADIFAKEESVASHQVGSCQVDNDLLYVTVADARQTEKSQQVDSLLGKVLCMTLDGNPAPGNPFYKNDNRTEAENYVWAFGLRNPFGLKVMDGLVFVADNGHNVDRFLEVQRGENYLWDGTDWSMGANANATFSPAIGPVRIEYDAEGFSSLPDKFKGTFFIATSAPQSSGIVAISYSLALKKLLEAPKYLLKYRGTRPQVVSGIALGKDGLYFVAIMPNEEGTSGVFRIAVDPKHEYPYLVAGAQDPRSLMVAKGCFGCHSLNNEGGTAGPPLDRDGLVNRVRARLAAPSYLVTLQEVDRLEREPFQSYRAARAQVGSSDGWQQVRLWITYHILEPRFDNPNSQMPNLGLSEAEAFAITDSLLSEQESVLDNVQEAIIQTLPAPLLPRHLLIFFAGGFAVGILFLGLGILLYPFLGKFGFANSGRKRT